MKDENETVYPGLGAPGTLVWVPPDLYSGYSKTPVWVLQVWVPMVMVPLVWAPLVLVPVVWVLWVPPSGYLCLGASVWVPKSGYPSLDTLDLVPPVRVPPVWVPDKQG